MQRIIFLILFAFFIQKVNAQKPIELDAQTQIQNFNQYLLVLEDEKRALLIENIVAGKHDSLFKPVSAKGMNYGLKTSNFWIKFQLQNKTPLIRNGIARQENLWYLENAYSTIDSLVLYHQSPKGDKSTGIAGGRVLKRLHTYPYISYIFPIQLNNNEIHTFYLKVNTLGPANIALSLKSAYDFEQSAFITQIFYGLFFGSLSVMMLYNLFLFTAIRKIRYLYYCAYIFFYIIAQLSNSGHGFNYIWAESVTLEKSILLLTVHIDIVFIVLFTFDFLEIKHNLPRLYRYYKGIVAYCIFSVLCFFFVPFILYILMTILWTFISTTLLFILGVYVWYKGERYARYFVIGWITFLIGLAILNVKNIGLIPDAFILHHIHQIGAVVEVLFFSIALADQINLFRAQKEVAQAESIRVSQENERILAEQNKLLEQKVKERTAELEQSREEVLSQNEQLAIQSEELREAYHDIKSSINYAKTIQDAMLPPLENLENLFQDAFVLFKPRDVVSGDFYWYAETDGKTIIAAADCTGHGVPGAFMSLISNDLLTEVILNRKTYEVDLILSKMHKGIRNILKQKETANRDGMDIALCVIDKQKRVMEFAGAHNPIIYFQNNELFYVKGDKLGIGGFQKEMERNYTKHIIPLDTTTTCYIFSDGFQDQFGSAERKKFGIRRMRELFQEIHTKQMREQEDILDNTITNWMGIVKEKQIDDILVVGFRIE